MVNPPGHTQTLHASCVSLDGAAVLIQGDSGSGKSGLALQLMAYGADLVADDQTVLERIGGNLIASSPANIRGQIEARGVGILSLSNVEQAMVRLAVDLDQIESERLPPQRHRTFLGQRIPLLYAVSGTGFAAVLLQVLKGGQRNT